MRECASLCVCAVRFAKFEAEAADSVRDAVFPFQTDRQTHLSFSG